MINRETTNPLHLTESPNPLKDSTLSAPLDRPTAQLLDTFPTTMAAGLSPTATQFDHEAWEALELKMLTYAATAIQCKWEESPRDAVALTRYALDVLEGIGRIDFDVKNSIDRELKNLPEYRGETQSNGQSFEKFREQCAKLESVEGALAVVTFVMLTKTHHSISSCLQRY